MGVLENKQPSITYIYQDNQYFIKNCNHLLLGIHFNTFIVMNTWKCIFYLLTFLFMAWKSGTLVFLQQHNPHAHHHMKMGDVYENLLLLLAFQNLLPFLPPLFFFFSEENIS